MSHMGQTSQRTYLRYANHTSVKCSSCDANLIGDTIDYGFADGDGRFAKYCDECRMRTYYDGPLPMAVPRTPPEFVQMKPPTPLPELEDNNDVYDKLAEHFRIVGIRLGVLAMFIFICLIYFR